jgi:hypothetical protein
MKRTRNRQTNTDESTAETGLRNGSALLPV